MIYYQLTYLLGVKLQDKKKMIKKLKKTSIVKNFFNKLNFVHNIKIFIFIV